jgi:ActR/RegA family two-component response regulator
MPNLFSHNAQPQRLLVVEDEYLIAAELTCALEEFGFEVIGPAASVEEALCLINQNPSQLAGAILDVNLQKNERVFPVANVLAARGIPFIFATGYDALIIPDNFAGIPRYEKPVDGEQLMRWFTSAASQGDFGSCVRLGEPS